MKPSVNLLTGDNRISLAGLAENSIDGCVTDPPYSLTSIVKRFGKPDSAPARRDAGNGNDGSFGRLSGGFMGKGWDATGIERDPEFWAEVYRVLKPGAFVFAFGGARTGHWQACAMAQAGFIMHPMHAWLYGQGFPKGHDASKAIDKHFGTTDLRTVTGTRYEARRFAPGATVEREGGYRKREEDDGNEQTFAATNEIGGRPEAQQWDGWKYGTQTQKPAMEPIYLGQKPYDGKPVESILKWGVGAFNIDGCRVPPTGEAKPDARNGQASQDRRYTEKGGTNFAAKPGPIGGDAAGRYPANVLHDGSDVVVALFPETTSGRLSPEHNVKASDNGSMSGGNYAGRVKSEFGGDSGSAARFFNNFPAEAFPWPLAFYHGKAGKSDRRAELVDRDAGEKPHPTVKPVGLLRHLARHICPPGGTILDPFAGTGTTAEAARAEGMNCVLMEAEDEYIEFLRRRFPEVIKSYDTGNTRDAYDDLLAPPMRVEDDYAELLGL